MKRVFVAAGIVLCLPTAFSQDFGNTAAGTADSGNLRTPSTNSAPAPTTGSTPDISKSVASPSGAAAPGTSTPVPTNNLPSSSGTSSGASTASGAAEVAGGDASLTPVEQSDQPTAGSPSGRKTAGGYSLLGGNIYGTDGSSQGGSSGMPATPATTGSGGAASAPRTPIERPVEERPSTPSSSSSTSISTPSSATSSGAAPDTARRSFQFNDATTSGWSQMTSAERDSYAAAMQKMSNADECRAFNRRHWAEMRARAQDGGTAMTPPSSDPCASITSSSGK